MAPPYRWPPALGRGRLLTVLHVGLTGNIAAGKSSVCAHWAAAGVPIISADELAREAVRPGSPGLAAVRAAFGETVIGADGGLDRSALRARVFSDGDARSRLEAILHPRILELRDAALERWRAEGASMVVSEIPLLFETGLQTHVDVTVLVCAPEDVRRRRLVERRGIDAAEAERMMAAQMDQEHKRALADLVIENAGSEAALEAAAAEVLAELRARSPLPRMHVDLHLHTSASWDCLSDPERVLETARGRGLGRIAITDHNRLATALRMARAHPDHVIPGEEVRTAEGVDVIGLYLSEEIAEGTAAVETIERIRAQGGIAYLPHPYAGGKGQGGRYADALAPLCDVVEVFNARLHGPTANARAQELAVRHRTLRGAGSDAHTLGEVGNAFVEVPEHANTPGALRAALERGRPVGREASRLVHLASTWAKVSRKLGPGR